MKFIKTLAWVMLGLVVLVGLSVFIFSGFLKKAAVPDYNAKRIIPSMEAEVTVFRDTFGIPHIYAKSERDGYRAAGYVMAQDRMWQMDLYRRVTMGRLSEIFGTDMISTDLLMRSLRIPEKSEKLIENINPSVLEALEAFAEGVNHYIQKHNLPPEFKILGYNPELWEPVHSINLIGYMAWDLTTPWQNEVVLQQLREALGDSLYTMFIPDMAKHPVPIISEFGMENPVDLGLLTETSEKLGAMGIEFFHGSNNWAVSGSKSTTGTPILANDMHLGFNIPGIWYQMHLVAGESLNVTGVVLPGQPFVISGHNDSIAWGMTNVMVDDMDFYLETLNDDSTRYMLDGEWKELEMEKVTIAVKGMEPVERIIRYTHRGPLINQLKPMEGPAVSMRWIGNEWSNELLSVYLLNRASNWEDFREAAKTFISVSQNIVYADYRGNIGIQISAGIPIRKGDIFGFYPGDTTAYDWQGIVPFEALPFEYNPSRGYVSSANNKTIDETYPYKVSYWFDMPNRINRIREMLEAKEKLSPEDLQDIQVDQTSLLARDFLGYALVRLDSVKDWNQTEIKALVHLKEWDFELTTESTATTIFELFYRKSMENLVKDDLPDKLFNSLLGSRTLMQNLLVNAIATPGSRLIDISHTEKRETMKDILEISFRETIGELSSTLSDNPDGWQWGSVHTFTLSHPLSSVKILDRFFKLNRGPFPVPGSFHTVAPYSYPYRKPYDVNHGASQRHIYVVGKWDMSKTVIPTGNSGIPSSPHYCDQTLLYLKGIYHDDPFSKEAVELKSKFRMEITGIP